MPRTTRIAWLLLATGTFAASQTLAGPVTYVSQLRTLNSNLREVEEFPLEDTLSGALAPGRYRFVVEHLVGEDVAVHHPYRVGLSLAGATPTPIPLPPAAAALAANAAGAAGLLVARQALGRRARQGNPFKRR